VQSDKKRVIQHNVTGFKRASPRKRRARGGIGNPTGGNLVKVGGTQRHRYKKRAPSAPARISIKKTKPTDPGDSQMEGEGGEQRKLREEKKGKDIKGGGL